jgi:hypothetical protein
METPAPLWELAKLADDLDSLQQRLADFQASMPPLQGAPALGLLRRLMATSEHLETASQTLRGRIPPRSTNDQALHGSTRTVPLPDLFAFLASTNRSGVLHVDTGSERFQVQFDKGSVSYAIGDHLPSGEALGDILCAAGVLNADQLQLLPDRLAQDAWLSPGLVESGWIARRDLESAVACQTRSVFLRLCRVGQARYSFEEGPVELSFSAFRHKPVELLMEATRSWDESLRTPATGHTILERSSAAPQPPR